MINKSISDPKQFRNNVIEKLFLKHIKDKKISTNFEKGVYNYSIRIAKKKKIVRKWENNYFVQI